MNSIYWDGIIEAYKAGTLDLDKGAKKLEEVLNNGGDITEAFLESLIVMSEEED